MVWMFASRYLTYFQEFKNILWKITLSFISVQWAIHCHQKALTEDLTCKNIHSDPQGLPTVLKTQFYLSTENMKYLKSFQGTEGYQGRKCTREERNHTSLSLKWIRMGVDLKPRISYYPPLFQDTFKVKAHMGCVDLLRTLELSDKLPGGHQRRSLASRHILQLRKNQGEIPWRLVWSPTWNSQWTLHGQDIE